MFNFFDFLLEVLTGGELRVLTSLAKILSKGGGGVRAAVKKSAAAALRDPKNVKTLVQQMLKDPKSLANGLKGLAPAELSQLNEAIDQARDKTEKVIKKGTKIEESKALSSSWLVHGLYIGNKISGLITITTIQGKSYNFPVPIPYTTWVKMKETRGRKGSGAGSIFHQEYWSKLRGATKMKVKQSIIFKLAGIAKKGLK